MYDSSHITSAPVPLDGRIATGKIGSLPWAVREQLNRRLHDGQTGSRILAWLNTTPEHRASGNDPITPQNLSAWRASGYAQWIEAQQKNSRLAAMAERAGHILSATGGDPSGVGARLLLGRLLEVVDAADDEDVPRLVDAVTALRKGEVDAARLELSRDKLSLETARFQRDTCKLFLEWYDDQAARDIATAANTTTAQKTELLGSLMFGDLWQGGASD